MNNMELLYEIKPTGSSEGERVPGPKRFPPWECHLVKNSTPQIVHLHWDHTGVKLFVASEDGKAEVYGMLDHLLNKWHVLYGTSFDGEPILSSCWLSLPRRVYVVQDKLDCMQYSDKYHVSLLTSTRGGFGGKALEGCVIVTATGLVGAMVSCYEDPSKVIVAVEKMVAVRSRIVCTDMAYSKEGDIVVVSSSDKLKQPVQLNRISVSLVGCRDKAEITVSASQSLFLPNFQDHTISAVKFVSKASTDTLLLSIINPDNGSSLICLYELVSHPIALKPRFQTNNDMISTSRWQQTSQIQFGSSVIEMCSLPLHLLSYTTMHSFGGMQNQQTQSQQQANAVMTSLTALSLSNGSVVLVRCDNLQQVGVINPTLNYKTNNMTGTANVNLNFPMKRERERDDVCDAKQAKFSSFFSNPNTSLNSTNCQGTGSNFNAPYVSMQFTWSGSLLVGLDNQSHLHVYKIHPNIDASTATTLIELSMIGGLDPWDVMMCVRQNLIENITDRLSETFARQPPPVQNHYNVRILVIKAALYRLACGGTARTNDQQTLLTLHLVSGALKSLLRPRDLSSHDKAPAESLSGLLSAKGEALSDINKVLVHIVPTEYAVEASTLQSVQQFLQWCADLALKLLATLPDLRHSRAPGWEVCRDSKAVGTLRELIVLMRIWGLIRPSCLPYFRKTSESLDVLPLLLRLLTRLSVAPHDPDESLIDEYTISGVTNPQLQHKATPPLAAAYAGLYFALAFAGLILLLVILGMLWDCKRRRRDVKNQIEKNVASEKLYPEIKEGSTYSESITTTAEVQPKQNLPPLYFNPSAPKKGLTFGQYNVHQQQPTDGFNSRNDLGETSSNTSSTHVNSYESTFKRAPSRLESFNFEDYHIDPSERAPLQDYLHITPGNERVDGLYEFGDEKNYDRNAATMPRKDSLKSEAMLRKDLVSVKTESSL